jgi:hypothetical protein
MGTTQGSYRIEGTKDWYTVSFDMTVPEKTDAIIVRCGMGESGKICFDNVSLRTISPEPAGASTDVSPSGGDPEELERITELSKKLLGVAREELGADVDLRREVHAKADGKYEVILYLSVDREER